MIPNVRNALLEGARGAHETHAAFALREDLRDGARPVDVFSVIADLGIPLYFAPLDNLLGACMRIDTTTVGILITTRRDLHMQRFTAAHELGHFVLEHEEGSLDREIRLPGKTSGRDIREIEADAFAAEFLMPKWLVSAVATRRGWWSLPRLSDPDVVYQLSLRLALSYEATCWGLASQSFISPNVAQALVSVPPKVSKTRALASMASLDDSWADVWLLDANDNGATLQASATDLLVLSLRERAATGYTWVAEEVMSAGFTVLHDSSDVDPSVVGGSAVRKLVVRAPGPGVYNLQMTQRRRFSSHAAPLEDFHVCVSAIGARGEGEYKTSTSSLVLN